jgi:molybdopterin synthase catalytic subunit/molybdopterin converting factor small subunit
VTYDTMRITVRLFAILRSRVGSSTVVMQVPSGATAAVLVDRFFADRSALVALRPHIRVAHNGTLIARDVELATLVLSDGDEVALLPPASGGAADALEVDELAASIAYVAGGRRIARILPAPLDNATEGRLVGLIAGEGDGAVVTFVGRTRATPGTPAPGEEATAARVANERVVGLEYEAAAGLAEPALAAICDELLAAANGAIGGIGVVHAEGSVPLGAVSLVAVVAAPHRAAAYAASQQLIDALKRDVPIWKLERFESGEVWSANADALRG